MYGKIFDSIYDGTLVEDWRALITFQQMIVLCDADGTIDMTPSAISKRTSIPIEHIKAGIEILENEDPYSRTEGEDGRRIVRLDDHRPWGWYLVNHEKYKQLQDSDTVRAQNRERKRRQRERENESRTVTDGHGQSRHIDTDTNTKKERSLGFDEFWAVYPRKRKKKAALDIWKRKRPNASVLIADVRARLTGDKQWLNGFVPDPTTYLNGERWNDDMGESSSTPATTDDYATQLGLTQNPGEAEEQFKIRVRDAMIAQEYA